MALQLALQQRHAACVQLLEAATQAAAEARQAALLAELEELEEGEAAGAGKKSKKKKVGSLHCAVGGAVGRRPRRPSPGRARAAARSQPPLRPPPSYPPCLARPAEHDALHLLRL